MDKLLAQAIIDTNVVQFGPSEKNKGDSVSCRFEPRNLLSSPEMLDHIGCRLGEFALTKCGGGAIIGMATSGIAWATLASKHSRLPLLYVRKTAERLVSNKLIEGIPPVDKKVILVDDLLFLGQSKREALAILENAGYTVTDILVVIDRELQKVDDGLPIEDEFNLNLHSLITMSDIVEYMKTNRAISDKHLGDLIRDYQRFQRWNLPDFATGA